MSVQEAIYTLRSVLGKENVITAKEDLICYSFDATADLPEHLPDLLVTPMTVEQVAEVIKAANRYKMPVYPRGSGTNLSGGTVPVRGGIVLSSLKMNKILEIDPDNLTATVQPGVIIQTLNNTIAPHGLIYPPDPGSMATATMGAPGV